MLGYNKIFTVHFIMRQFITLAIAIIASTALMASNPADTVSTNGSPHPMPEAVGLTLSGGGAKGIAHIGVIKALEDNGIPIDCITGTSMGAIVGGLYAMGYSPEEMLALIESEGFQYWSAGVLDPQYTYYFLEQEDTPALFNLSLGKGRSGNDGGPDLPTSLINPIAMNFAFMELFAPYTARCGGDFNQLMVPYRCVASDVNRKRKAIFSQGDLGDCIRASMSFPLVFHPTEIDGRPMYDGGIYDNFPVDVMLSEFNPEVMIGVDVSSGNSPDEPDANMMDQLEALIMQRSDYQVPQAAGMRIKLDLDQFALLDFAKAPEIYKIGYDHAMSMMDSIKARIPQRTTPESVAARRKAFKAGLPELNFDEVEVVGGKPSQNRYIRSLFTRHQPDTIGLSHIRDGYYRAVTPGKLINLTPHAQYDTTYGLFDLRLKANVKNDYNVALGGFLTTSSNSMLYLSGGFRTLDFNSLDLRLSGWIGQSYLAACANMQFQLMRDNPSAIGLQAVASRQNYNPRDRYFFQSADATVLSTEQYFGRITYGMAAGRKGKAELAFGAGHVEDKTPHPSVENGYQYYARLRRTLFEAILRYEHTTLDNHNYPTAGHDYKATLQADIGTYRLKELDETDSEETFYRRHREWGRFDMSLLHYFKLNPKLVLGTKLLAAATTDKMLPPSYLATLAILPAYVPSADMSNILTGAFRARHFGVIGIEPVLKLSQFLQIRGRLEGYMPYRAVKRGAAGEAVYGRPWHDPEFFGELRGVIQMKFASVTAYTHYTTAHDCHWNFGLTLGLYLPAPSFFR